MGLIYLTDSSAMYFYLLKSCVGGGKFGAFFNLINAVRKNLDVSKAWAVNKTFFQKIFKFSFYNHFVNLDFKNQVLSGHRACTSVFLVVVVKNFKDFVSNFVVSHNSPFPYNWGNLPVMRRIIKTVRIARIIIIGHLLCLFFITAELSGSLAPPLSSRATRRQQLIYLLGFFRFSEEIIFFLKRNAKKKLFKSNKMNFFYLVFCGNKNRKPSSYPIKNWSNVRKTDIHSAFQKSFQKRYWRWGINFAIET